MAGDERESNSDKSSVINPRPRHKQTAASRKVRHPKRKKKHDSAAPAIATSARPPNLDALRKARLRYLDTPAEERSSNMKYVYEKTVAETRSGGKESERRSSVAGPVRRKSEEPTKSRKRKESSDRDTQSDEGYVYGPPDNQQKSRERSTATKSKSRSRDHLPHKATSKKAQHQTTSSSKATTKRPMPRRNTEPPVRRSSCPTDESTVITEVPPPAHRRRTIVVEETSSRPSLKRSATTGEAQTEVSLARSITTTSPSKRKDSGIFSGLLLPKASPVERKVPCLTCGADDVPISKSARLPCKHRMCHTCLRRIFKMSITDPAHMPPRCCTDDHIDLKHVDKLFDQNFKKNWNRKFLEYKTKNKVYCIGKNCGEWIKPNHITNEHGRKIGKCKRCGTRVCAICNNKAHISRDCPKDPETKQFIETAKQKGWQKCYSCSAMVELKEGCNHMTCRCTAEFCMVCGLKWKSCDCPWFNYENVDAHLGNPARYQEEMDRRRDQERRDEALARRMQALGVGAAGTGDMDDDQRGGDIFGIGNAAGHHMNQNFIQQAREALTANYQNAEQAARGLLNGWVTARLPGGMDDVPVLLNNDRERERNTRGPDRPRDRDRERRRDQPQQQQQQQQQQEDRGIPDFGLGMSGRDRDRDADAAGDGRPVRRNTTRRRTLIDMLAAPTAGGGRSQTNDERENERRIYDWANGVATA